MDDSENIYFGYHLVQDGCLDPVAQDNGENRRFFQDTDDALQTTSKNPSPPYQYRLGPEYPYPDAFAAPTPYPQAADATYQPSVGPSVMSGFEPVIKKKGMKRKWTQMTTPPTSCNMHGPDIIDQQQVPPPITLDWRTNNYYRVLNPETPVTTNNHQDHILEARSFNDSACVDPAAIQRFGQIASVVHGSPESSYRPMTPPGQPIGIHSSHSWNQEVYILGDRTQPRELLPLTPQSSERPRSGTNTALSVSISGLTCESCGKSFTRPCDFNHHRRWHGPRTHACAFCDQAFVFSRERYRHEKTHDKTKQKLPCPEPACSHTFTREDNRHRHVKAQHPWHIVSPPATSSIGGG